MACVESHTTSKLKHISIGIMLAGWLVLANARCMTATVCFLSFWFTLNLVPVLVLVVAFLFWFRFLGNIGSKNNYHIFLISSTHCLDRSSLVAIYITHAHTAHMGWSNGHIICILLHSVSGSGIPKRTHTDKWQSIIIVLYITLRSNSYWSPNINEIAVIATTATKTLRNEKLSPAPVQKWHASIFPFRLSVFSCIRFVVFWVSDNFVALNATRILNIMQNTYDTYITRRHIPSEPNKIIACITALNLTKFLWHFLLRFTKNSHFVLL